MTHEVQKLNAEQIENIVDKVAPLIAEDEDLEFFKGVLFCKLESCASSAEAAYFVKKLLNGAE